MLRALPCEEGNLAWLHCTGTNPVSNPCPHCDFGLPLLTLNSGSPGGGGPQGWGGSSEALLKPDFSPAEDIRVCQGSRVAARPFQHAWRRRPHPGEGLPQLPSHPFIPWMMSPGGGDSGLWGTAAFGAPTSSQPSLFCA